MEVSYNMAHYHKLGHCHTPSSTSCGHTFGNDNFPTYCLLGRYIYTWGLYGPYIFNSIVTARGYEI